MRFALCIALAVATTVGACSSSAPPNAAGAPVAGAVLVAVVASPESTISLTRRALSTARGTLPIVEWQAQEALLSSSYTKNRGGPGTAEILVVAAVSRRTFNLMSPQHGDVRPTTRVELRAWAMDSVAMRPVLGGSRATGFTRMHRPRPVSASDSTEWVFVLRVLEVLVESGARVVP